MIVQGSSRSLAHSPGSRSLQRLRPPQTLRRSRPARGRAASLSGRRDRVRRGQGDFVPFTGSNLRKATRSLRRVDGKPRRGASGAGRGSDENSAPGEGETREGSKGRGNKALRIWRCSGSPRLIQGLLRCSISATPIGQPYLAWRRRLKRSHTGGRSSCLSRFWLTSSSGRSPGAGVLSTRPMSECRSE